MDQPVRKTRNLLGRLLGAALLSMFLGGALFACGGAQVPPSDGQCHQWREWVSPEQNDDGEWTAGYCRDRD